MRRVLFAAAIVALSLAACDDKAKQQNSQPVATAAATPPPVEAPESMSAPTLSPGPGAPQAKPALRPQAKPAPRGPIKCDPASPRCPTDTFCNMPSVDGKTWYCGPIRP